MQWLGGVAHQAGVSAYRATNLSGHDGVPSAAMGNLSMRWCVGMGNASLAVVRHLCPSKNRGNRNANQF